MAPPGLPLLLLLLLLSSSSSLLTPAAAVCAPRSSPYQVLFDHYLPAPVVGDDTSDFDDDDSPSPLLFPSVNSPATSPSPAPKASAPAALTPKPSAPTPSPAPKASAPAAATPKPSTASPSPAPKASAPAAPTPKPSATSRSPATKASAPAAPTPKPSTTSPSPAPKASTPASTPKPSAASPSLAPESATAAPTPGPKASQSGGGDDGKHAPSAMDNAPAKAIGAVADAEAGVSSVSGILDPSLKPICAMVPYPAICEANVKAAAPKSLKSVDVRSAFTLMMEAYTDEIRDIRDKSRALATNDLYSDPLNSCNRSLGYMLRTSKEMATSFESGDGGTLKSGMDALMNSLMSCKEKPTAIQNDMVRLYNIWDNIEAIFEKLYPALDPDRLFPRNR